MRQGSFAKLNLLLLIFVFINSCASLQPFGKTLRRDKIPTSWTVVGRGLASHYSTEFVGRATASGELYDEDQMTAAHPTLPFGTLVLVRRTATGRYVLVRVNDRGPFVKDRTIDLSRAAAAKVGLLAAGLGRVELFVIPPHDEMIAHL